MQALIVEPMKPPYVKEIGEELEDLQHEVGGYIEAIYPFEDEVAIICNEEGKDKLTVYDHPPMLGKDYNEDLLARQQRFQEKKRQAPQEER